ncbi:hypothetical protein LINGRAHAP2_LOCUS18803 [Linum grandiflorum]
MKRSGSRNKLLACFRPDFHMEEMIADDGLFLTRSKSAALLAAVEKNSKPILHRSVSNCSVSTVGVSSENSDSDETTVVGHRIRRKKSFSRAVKSIVSDIFHSKSKNRRSRIQGSELTTRTDSDRVEHVSTTRKEYGLSSVLGSESDNKSTAGKIKKPDPEPERKRSENLTLLILLLVSLAVTVLGGQLLGVALTSISLYSIPHRRVIAGGSSETECKKQRVVMGGGMKRSHRRQDLQSMI